MPYLGKTPSQATRARYYLTASGGETSISGSMTVGGTLTFTDGNFVDVSVNGVALVAGTDYNTNTANTIAGLSALTASDQVEIIVYDTFSVFSGDVDSDFSVGGNLSVTGTATLTGNADFNGDLDVDGTTNLDVVDIDGAVDMASTLQVDGAITSSAGATITTADNNPQLILKSTDADANSGPILDLVRDSGSPADGDEVGVIRFKFDDDAGEVNTAARFTAKINDASNGTEDGELEIITLINGSSRSRIEMLPTETVINEDSQDIDFRIESNDQSDMFFVDAGNNRIGIGTNAPVNTLDLIDNGNGAAVVGRIRNEGGAAGDDATLELSIATASEEMRVLFTDSSGTAGQIVVDGGDNSMAFETGTTERMRIDDSGNFFVGKTSTGATVDGVRLTDIAGNANQFSITNGTPMNVNRNGDEGNLITFTHDGTAEGSISVSGTTVSYNGGHLSRWSQATNGKRIDGLVKGTVMTNLDQMAKWHHEAKAATLYEDDDEIPEGKKVGDEKTPAVDAYDEDNEQLNCMAVSSVEGDANVAGVFVNWDEDDDYNDMNVAMTGDMVIRIAKDTTVARGDLLMSAGDGTAKPQGDDIVRSKTIAKVTSITKSHTYDDGSYLVPCVLMAC